jgi:tRNA dimethylallyltransferase
MKELNYDMAVILGPTASGKTEVAVDLAFETDGEIISADSRQIYRGMDLGTGKDLDEYHTPKGKVPYHLIDIADAGYQYNVYQYQRDFLKVFEDLKKRSVFPVMCGGSGMYLEAVLKGYQLIQVPVNEKRREELNEFSLEKLTELLSAYKKISNTSDIENKKRAIRAIEIEEYRIANSEIELSFPSINSLIIGIHVDRETRRRRITSRLNQRLKNGMIEEVKGLLEKGLKPDDLIYYGLEYKYLTLFVTGKLTYEEMRDQLNIAIHQFAKRQMTWFRKMEREGFPIHWIDGNLPLDEKTRKILSLLRH